MLNVLLVEDDFDLADTVSSTLNWRGYVVIMQSMGLLGTSWPKKVKGYDAADQS